MADPNPQNRPSWQRRVLAAMQKEKIGYEVWELEPDRGEDDKYQIAGTTTGIAHQISLFMALREYQEFRNPSPSWKQFEYNYERCFPVASAKSPHWGNEQNPWGLPQEHRPKFKVLYPPSGEPSDREFLAIEFWPDRSNDDDSFLLFGYLKDIIPQVAHIQHTRQILAGATQLVGYPISEWVRRSPNQGISVKIILTNYPDPPFYKSQNRQDFKIHQVSIPFVKKELLTYSNLRSVCGGSAGLGWGPERAVAWVADNTDNYPGKKGMPQMSACGGNRSEAISNVKKFIQLADVRVVNFRKNEPIPEETPNLPASERLEQLQEYKVYPAYIPHSADVG